MKVSNGNYSISFTDAAIKKISSIVAEENKAYIRLGVKGGSCEGYSYIIDTADYVNSKDLCFEFIDFVLIVDPKSVVLLNNIEIDYEKSLISEKFVFNNPNAKTLCGCGASFSI